MWNDLAGYVPKALDSLNADLAMLSNAETEAIALPNHWANSDDALFLKQMLRDETYEAHSQRVIQAWKAWQGVLAHQGLNALPTTPTFVQEAKAALPPIPPMDLRAVYDKSDIMAGCEAEQMALLARLAYPIQPGTPISEIKKIEALREKFLETSNSVSYSDSSKLTARYRELRVAKAVLPILSESWTPLASHLNQCSIQFSDLEVRLATQKDPEIQKFRNLAKQRLLKRFRNTLWLCNLIWAQTMGEEGPEKVSY
jgi:hypothetical protein